MNKIMNVFVLILSLNVYSQSNYEIQHFKDSLALELCQIYGLDQGVRNSPGFENKMMLVRSIDTFNLKRMVYFIKENGMPSEKLLGKRNYSQDCVAAAFISVMLHSPHIIANDKEYFNFFVDLVKKGELESQKLALILDKYYILKKGRRSVLYGSQFGMPCLNYKNETNNARQEIGLPPLKESEFVDCNSTK